MRGRYAADTEVPVQRSKQQIEDLLRAHQAEGFHSGWDSTRDVIEFLWKGKQIRFVLPRPNRRDFLVGPRGFSRTPRQIDVAIQQADRQRWRALYLVVRAKIEAVEANLSVFEEEFLAFIVVPGTNQTLGEILLPRLQAGQFDISRALPAPAPPPH